MKRLNLELTIINTVDIFLSFSFMAGVDMTSFYFSLHPNVHYYYVKVSEFISHIMNSM